MGITIQLHREDLGPAPLAPALFGDDFDGADGTPIDGDRVPPKTRPGQDYAVSATGNGYGSIRGGAASAVGVTSGMVLTSLNTGRTDYDVVMGVSGVASVATRENAIIAAFGTGGSGSYIAVTLRRTLADPTYALVQFNSGTPTVLAGSSREAVAGGVVRIARRGDLYTVWVNGEFLLEASATLSPGTYAGMRFSANDPDTRFNTFRIYAR